MTIQWRLTAPDTEQITGTAQDTSQAFHQALDAAEQHVHAGHLQPFQLFVDDEPTLITPARHATKPASVTATLEFLEQLRDELRLETR